MRYRLLAHTFTLPLSLSIIKQIIRHLPIYVPERPVGRFSWLAVGVVGFLCVRGLCRVWLAQVGGNSVVTRSRSHYCSPFNGS